MATPKSKTSKARSAQRRSHDALSVMPSSVCKTCGEKNVRIISVRHAVRNNNHWDIGADMGAYFCTRLLF